MFSRHSAQGIELPATLTGLRLAVSIARDGADAMPVVTQTLGAAVRILALAEKIDQDREALHALADRSLQLAQRVKDVMDGRTPDERILASFKRITRAFDGVEAFMTKHTRRTRLRRAIGYVFTVPLHVDRLSRELTDAVQELFLVVLLDVNLEAHAMPGLVAENARYAGEFRLLRHCDVEKLEPVEFHWRHSDIGVRYHRARVDGQLAIVRYLEGTESHNSRILKSRGRADYELITAHDRIIEELSTVQNSHRNVARIYGWGRGSSPDRFTVFKYGYRPAQSVLGELSDPVTTGIQWACKDAIDHLQRLRIFWAPKDPPYAIDDSLEPTIGLWNELRRIDNTIESLSDILMQNSWVLHPLVYLSSWQEVAATGVQAVISDFPTTEQLTSLLGTANRRRYVISKATLSNGFLLKDGTAERLLRVLAEGLSDAGWRFDSWMWVDILLALDKRRSHRLQNGLQIIYITQQNGSDWLEVHGLAEDSERIVYDYSLAIPDAQHDGVREMLGIPAHCEDEPLGMHIIATGGPGTYRAVE